MKKCYRCNDFAIYEDSVDNCPVCGTRLETYTVAHEHRESPAFEARQYDEPVRPVHRNVGGQGATDTRATGGFGSGTGGAAQGASSANRDETPQFETRRGGRHVFRGRITEASHQLRDQRAFEKIGNSVFHGEPYRTGRDLRQSVIRVEEFTRGRRAVRMQDVVFCGDAEGRFIIGDDVTIETVRCGSGYYVTHMYVHTTENSLLPDRRVPAFAVRLFLFAFLCLIAAVVMSVYGFFAHGGVEALTSGLTSVMWSLFAALLPILIPLGIVWYFAGRLFRRRRR
jgi:hypothetical protein